MEWINALFLGESTAHAVLIIAIVIAIGIALGKLKIAGISLGITWILFVGIVFSHFGMRLDPHTLHFVKEFGLILFVYSIGLQVGPGFFASFKKEGIRLNLLAVLIVALGVLTTYILYITTDLNITTMVGILSGAVTNTPGLGAAQQAYYDMTGNNDPTIALGYAVAYPLGVIGIILSIVAIRHIFQIKLDAENTSLKSQLQDNTSETVRVSLEVDNPKLFEKTVLQATKLIDRKFVISRIFHHNGLTEIVTSHTLLEQGDKILVIASTKDLDAIRSFVGKEIQMNYEKWENLDSQFIQRKIIITKSQINGKSLEQLRLRSGYGVNITRVDRSGVDLVAHPSLKLQIGDRVVVVGSQSSVDKVALYLGNSIRRLREPNLIPIFLGIFLGVFFGSIPFIFPGIPQPVKLGLAGGPLVVAILIGRFGPQYKLVTYTTVSANLMLRELGISLFLASVGLGAGEGFVSTIIDGGGYAWIGYGVIITVVPLLLVGILARLVFKLDYFTIMGLLAGSTTDPPALAYSNATSHNDLPAVSYATVYPLTMFLRVLSAQLIILFML